MRASVYQYRQNKFDWSWKYIHGYQAHTTLKEVLNKAKKIIIKKKKDI